MSIVQLNASFDSVTGQHYVPPRRFVADGSGREARNVQVAAQGVLYSQTSFRDEWYGIVDLDCGSRIQVLLAPDTTRIGARVVARQTNELGQPRFEHE
jgi:uncharacterized OB-fold protein